MAPFRAGAQGFAFIVGIEPHKGSHTVAVLDRSECVIDKLRAAAGAAVALRRRLQAPHLGIEAASGRGALLAQELVAAGETVLDVPPTLSARVRLLDSGGTDKTDPHDAGVRRSSRCGTAGCAGSPRWITPRCWDC